MQKAAGNKPPLDQGRRMTQRRAQVNAVQRHPLERSEGHS
jgi:hypothetical protein